MFRNYLKVALRSLGRHKIYTVINVLGLAVGMACCLLLLLFVRDERSYDRFHAHADRIYRVVTRMGVMGEFATMPVQTAPNLEAQFPEVESVARLLKTKQFVMRDGVYVEEERFLYTDPGFFRTFSFPLLEGDPETALSAPDAVVLTRSTARRYFGDGRAVGQPLRLRDGPLLRVSGIAADPPANSHLRFDFLASLDGRKTEGPAHRQGPVYLRLTEPAAAARLQAALDARLAGSSEEVEAFFGWFVEGMQVRLQPITDIHLGPDLISEIEPNGDARYLYLFSAIAALILAIACINYMNLATARSAGRAAEVGVRKVLGAGRMQLVRQFLGESMIFCLLALALAVLLVELALPGFNRFTGKALVLPYTDAATALFLAGIVLVVGGLAGSYPALFLSRFQPVLVLKSRSGPRTSGAWLRKGLVVVQFAISIALIVATLVIDGQLRFMQHKRLGFDREQVVSIPLRGALAGRPAAFKEALRGLSGVRSAAASSGTPLDAMDMTMERDGEMRRIAYLAVDHDYVQTMGLELVEGRDFSPGLATDGESAILINEAALRQLRAGEEDAHISRMKRTERGLEMVEAEHVGVVRDFHTGPLHEPIVPTVLYIAPDEFTHLVVRLHPNGIPETLAAMERLWAQFVPDHPFGYTFLDEAIERQYHAERRLARIFTGFSLLAVLVACLGLFGLAAFTAEQRTKEIGVRKVLGASVPGLVALLSRDFLLLVLVAAAVATPLAYFAAQRWLEGFAYRISVGAGFFLLAGGLALLIALLTVSAQAVRAALADPVKALRYE